jgi:hypothetical protein
MGAMRLWFSPQGRLSPGDFARTIVPFYVVALLSWALLSDPVRVRLGLPIFALAQAVLIWCWFAIHRKRARDANAKRWILITATVAYAISILFVVLFILETYRVGDVEGSNRAMREAPLVQFYLVLLSIYAFQLLSAWDFDLLMWEIKFAVLVPYLPSIFCFAYSIWLARQPTAPDPLPTGDGAK